LFLGAKLVRPTLFLAAFGCATIAAFFATDTALITAGAALPPVPSCAVLVSVPLVFGLLAGGLALCCLDVVFVVLGAGAGAGLGYSLYTGALHAIPSPKVGQHDVTYIACISAGILVGAIVLCKCKETIMICATSCIGAAGVTSATAMLLAHANIRFLGPVQLTSADDTSPFVWSQALFFLLMFAVGVLVQSRINSRKKHSHALRTHQVPLITP